ncbi:uncharacterized protein K441DRAFT_660099 [Cenococcum geophilum 1.58]|uniref:uncharacterized protein n=1 Tax=Cenococcum geophilum 1.58 TaxID=794803 RepID=UPI00358F12A2|nr:hypothetical protein K441DRAFT_660099 [Cenococcum geophilum 1.58]
MAAIDQDPTTVSPTPTPTPSIAPAGVPKYVLDYAPLVHLHSKELYKPADIGAQLLNTRPQINFVDVGVPSSPLTLHNLDQLNKVGTKGGQDVYLTSKVDITTNPPWLNGVAPDANGKTNGATTCCIIVVDHGSGNVDAFYLYFFAFNWGGVVLNKQLGNHVGDWEQNMIRFSNGVPKYVWYSQHGNGEAFEYRVLKKDKSGKRPLVYCSNGSHANYATPGVHDHTFPNHNLDFPFLLVDHTDEGPLWDPTLSAYYVSYDSTKNSFTPYDSTTPIEWLNYVGRWGDQQYPDKDKRQKQLAGNRKYVGGPTGPQDKQLNRKNVCPVNGKPCILRDHLGP